MRDYETVFEISFFDGSIFLSVSMFALGVIVAVCMVRRRKRIKENRLAIVGIMFWCCA